jgi:acetoin utilization protein AcuB
MADKKIGGLPVVRNGNVVGIITETDLFKLFLELFGGREPGVRISVTVPNLPGELAKLTKTVFDIGGNIVALGTFAGKSTQNREVVLKVNQVNVEAIQKAVEPVVEQITDIREPALI